MQLDTARQWSALATISFLPCKKECWFGSVVVVPHPLHAGLPSFRRRVISSTRDALLQAVQVSTRCSQPPGARCATPSHQLTVTRYPSRPGLDALLQAAGLLVTSAPARELQTHHTRGHRVWRTPIARATVCFIDIQNIGGHRPPPDIGVETPSRLLVYPSARHTVTLGQTHIWK